MFWSLITHCVTRHGDERAPHGGRNGNHVVDNASVLGVGDICDVEDGAHGVRQALQTAAGLLGFGHEGRQWGPLQTGRESLI